MFPFANLTCYTIGNIEDSQSERENIETVNFVNETF